MSKSPQDYSNLPDATIFNLWKDYDKCEDFTPVLLQLLIERSTYKEALEKVEDPRKMDHKERDNQTQMYCLMNVANTALEQFRVPLKSESN